MLMDHMTVATYHLTYIPCSNDPTFLGSYVSRFANEQYRLNPPYRSEVSSTQSFSFGRSLSNL